MKIEVCNERELHQLADFYKYTEVMRIAIQIGIFGCLGHKGSTVEALCEKYNVEEGILLPIINILVQIGLLKEENKYVTNSELSLKYLTDKYHSDLSSLFMHNSQSEFTKDNIINKYFPDYVCDRKNEIYMQAMQSGNRFSACYIGRQLKKMNIQSVLDVGCGSGIYTIEFCKYIHSIQKVVCLDRQEILNITRENIEKANLTKDICYVSSELEDYEIQEKFDCMIFSNVFHFFGEEAILDILKKYVKGLSEHGVLVIQDMFWDEDGNNAMYALEWISNGSIFVKLQKMINLLNEIGMKISYAKKIPNTDSSVLLAEWESVE